MFGARQTRPRGAFRTSMVLRERRGRVPPDARGQAAPVLTRRDPRKIQERKALP